MIRITFEGETRNAVEAQMRTFLGETLPTTLRLSIRNEVRPIEAIKALRSYMNLSLKEAKDHVERLMHNASDHLDIVSSTPIAARDLEAAGFSCEDIS